jgi:hypothetical protein
LCGSGIRRRFGREITGELLSGLYRTEDLPPRFRGINDVVKSGEPSRARIIHMTGDVEVMKLELFQMPVTAPNGVDRWVLAFALYF